MSELYLNGIAALTPWGLGIESLLNRSGSPGNGDSVRLPELDAADYGWKGLRRYPRLAKACTMVIGEALQEAGAGEANAPFPEDNTGLVVGCSLGQLEAIDAMLSEADVYGEANVNPGLFPFTVVNVLGGCAAAYFKLRGPNVTISQEEASALKCWQYACDLLQLGQARQVVVCLVDALPAERFREAVAAAPAHESITAYVLGKQPRSQGGTPSVSVTLNSQHACHGAGSCASRTESAELPARLLEAVHRLRQRIVKSVCLSLHTGAEGGVVLNLRGIGEE